MFTRRNNILIAVIMLVFLTCCQGPAQSTSSLPVNTILPTEKPRNTVTTPPTPSTIPTKTIVIERISKPGEYNGYSEPLYQSYEASSQYITMRDGIKLAADIYRPTQDGTVVDTPLPVIWSHVPYHRENFSYMADFLVKYGYVVGAVDARGTGASYGTYVLPPSPEDSQDEYDITEWFAAQPWSDGNIGMFGMSTLADFQMTAAGAKPPHLKAIFPEYGEFDYYDQAYPGGVFEYLGISEWSIVMDELDDEGKAVDEDEDGSMLQAALLEHQANSDIFKLTESLPFRDSQEAQSDSQIYLTNAPNAFLSEVKDSGVAVYLWGGWLDLYTPDTLIWFKNLSNPRKIVIGPWSHAEYGTPDHMIEHLRWFDYWLKGIDNGIMQEAQIYYYTIGPEEKAGWHTALQWPLPDVKLTNYYFSGEPSGSVESANDGYLSLSMSADAIGLDNYVVDYSTTNGLMTRWQSDSGEMILKQKRNDADTKGLTYTTSPLTSEVEVTGYPVIHLWVSSTTKDGDFFVNLEDVDESGNSYLITEGILRASHRALSTPPFDNLGLPYHRSYAEDVAELPNKPVELVFNLYPTSYIFDTGHRIRITITCSDKDNFITPQIDPAPTVSVYRDADHPTYIVLPINP